MSMATLERAILAAARGVFKNPKLRNKDIMEWRSAVIKPEADEVVEYVPDPGVWVAIKKAHDKRK